METKTNAEMLGNTVMIVPAAVYTDYVERTVRAETLLDHMNEKVSDLTIKNWRLQQDLDNALAKLAELEGAAET